MSSLRLVHALLLLSVYYIQTVVAGPMEVSNRYQKLSTTEQDDWRLVLSSIESRLKSLDFLYTSQLTPTIEARLENFQNRISGFEVKLLRIEALLTSRLDRMSDNISSRHFRDDMVQTDLFRKMEAAYDAITHRLAYMDRKWESNILKLQDKHETFTKRMDTMNNALTDKYDSIESQLSDIVDGMEEINISFSNIAKRVTNDLWRGRNNSGAVQLEMQDFPKNNPFKEMLNEVKDVCGNSGRVLDVIHLELMNMTKKEPVESYFNNFSDYFGNVMNEYASKVSDLGEQVTKSDNKIAVHLRTIEKVVNSSEIEMQNALRALMVQVGRKMSSKNDVQNEVADQKILEDMSKKLDTNFEQVISTQNTFLESCHRLQMDESQIESQISDILNKLIDNFEATTGEHRHVLKKMEALLVKHDLHTKKELHQANTNIKIAYEQSKTNSGDIKERYKQTNDKLEVLLALVENILGSGSAVSKKEIAKEKEMIENIQSLERALNFTITDQTRMLQSYTAAVETILREIKKAEEHFMPTIKQNIEDSANELRTNITMDILEYIERKYKLLQEIHENVEELSNFTNTEKNKESKTMIQKNANATESEASADLDSIIRSIFFNNETNITSSTTVIPYLDIDIDVRSNFEELSNNGFQVKRQNASEFNIALTSEKDQENNSNSSEVSSDLILQQNELSNGNRKPYSIENHNTESPSYEEKNRKRKTEKSTTNVQLQQELAATFEIKNGTYSGNTGILTPH